MNSEKKKRLERSGWTAGGAADFLRLSPEEAKFIELKLALDAAMKELRVKRGLTQTALASRLGSSRPRVAKMKAGDSTVSIDLLIRPLLTIGVGSADIARWIQRTETTRAA
ncbi:MAG: helix-turn-helix transcriptional regulator [Acidobacteria bacterium]|nr:helix-turn-helix transcriptional regulator [Acidobacteriota bacterium]